MVTSTNKGLSEPASGALNWNTDLNGNFEIIDKAMGAAVSISLTGLSTYATSAAQCQYMSMNFTGTPSADVAVSIPTGVAGQWVIQNNTNKTITVSSLLGGASTAVVVAGSIRSVYCNGTNVYFADAQSGGSDTQIAYTSGGTLTGSTDLTFNGATESIGASAAVTGWSSGSGTFTATFNANKLVPVGSYVFLTGVTTTPSTPNGFNAAFAVTASTQAVGASTVTFAATGIGASPAGGTLAYGNLKIGGTNVTASAAELSNMAGVTSTPYSSTNLATQAQAEAGTDNTTLMTPLRTEQHMVANDLGWGQTWQNVLASRVGGTSYQNTTSRPIMVNMVVDTASKNVQVSSDNATWITIGITGSSKATFSFVVPVSWYYRLDTTATINAWAELR